MMKDSKTKFTKQKFLKDISKIWKMLFLLIYIVSLMGGVTAKPVQAVTIVTPISNAAASFASTTAGTNDVSFSYTSATGDNRLMLVGISWNSLNSAVITSEVTFGTSSLTKVIESRHSGGERYSAIYSLLAPVSNLTETVKVTFNGAIANGIVVGAATFANVNQTDPLDDPVSNSAGSGSTSITSPAMITTGDELIFDNLFIGGSSLNANLTPGADQIKFTGWDIFNTNTQGAASHKAATGTSTTMSWSSATASNYWVLTAVPINPVVAGTTYDLTIVTTPDGGGTTDPSGSFTGTVHPYVENAVVDITATPATGYEFVNWTGACTGTDPAVCQVTMDADKTVTANFTVLDVYTLSVSTYGSGSVTLDPAAGPYYDGDVVTLTPVPSPCWKFNGWTGTDASDVIDTGPSYTIAMDEDKSVIADFVSLDPGVACYRVNAGGPTWPPDAPDTGPNFLSLLSTDLTTIPGLTVTGVTGSGSAVPDATSIDMTGVEDYLPTTLFRTNLIQNPATTDPMSFNFEVPNGEYDVLLHFMEQTAVASPGRYFDIWLEGVEELADYNVYELTGDVFIADTVALTTTVADSSLTLEIFADESIPNIRGIEIIPAAAAETPIDSVTITEITAPVANVAPDTAAAVSVTGVTETTPTVTWTPTVVGTFGYSTIYTASVTLTAMEDFVFGASPTATVNGSAATSVTGGGTDTLIVTYAFPATGAEPSDTPINSVAITDITVPVAGEAQDTQAAISTTGVSSTTPAVSWTPNDNPFGYSTVYTASVTLTAMEDYVFGASPTAQVNGSTAVVQSGGGTKTLVVTYAFPETEEATTTEITIDGAVSNATGNEMGASDDPLEFAHTTGTGSGRLMLVGISWNSGTSAVNIDSVEFSYDTTNLPLTEVHTEQVTVSGTVSGPRFAAIYSLENPPSGQLGTITITFDADVPNGIVAGAINFAGVHPTTPLGTPDGAHATDTSTHPSLTFSDLASGVLVFDTAFLGGQDDSYNLAVGPDQTQRWNDFAGNARGTSSTEMAASPVTMSWTASTTNWWALAAVPINPANYVPPTQWTITATAGTGGTISPSGPVLVNEGASRSFTITPNSGYLIADVLVDTVSVGAVSTYNFNNVVANHTIAASFTLAPVPVTFTGTELLGRPTDTSISVKVVPDVDIELYYEYGTTSGDYTDDTDTTTADAGVPKTVEITGLTPNTQYFYRMQYRSSGGTTFTPRAEGSFWTQRAEGSTFTVDITSDSHIDIMLGNQTTWTNTLNKIATDDPDFLFDLGDTIAMYDNVGIGDVAGAESVYIDSLQSFNIVSDSVPVFLTPGNHENQEGWHYYNDEDSRNIIGVNAQKKFFLNPVPDDFYSGDEQTDANIVPDGFTEAYYSFTWGDALFVVINPYWYTEDRPYADGVGGGGDDDSANVTVTGDVWTWTLGQEQFEWLKATLEGSNAKYKFVLTHQLVSDGSWTNQEDYGHGGAKTNHIGEWGGYNENGTTYAWETMRPGWGPDTVHDIMVDNCVSTVFHGHDHQYAYESRDGVIYTAAPSASFTGNFNGYTVGTGGLGAETIYANSASQQPGYIKLTVGPSQATVAYMQTAGTSATHTYTVPACSDTTSPSVTINQDAAQEDPTTISPINFTVVFSEPVTGFETGDVTLGGTAGATTAVVSAASGDGTIYNVAVSGMTQSGTVTATVAAGKAQDGAGNPNLASTSTDNTVTFTVPVTPLTVTINQAVGQADPTDTSPINFTVVFSAPVTDFATGDVTLSGTAGATTAIVTGSGTTYNVAVSGMTQSGTVIATILAGVAQDAASTPNQASTSTDNTVTYNKPIYIYLPLILKNP